MKAKNNQPLISQKISSKVIMKTKLKRKYFMRVLTLIALFVNFLFSACAFDQSPKLFYIHDLAQKNSTNTTTTLQFSVGGTVTGLTGSGLVIQNNGADNINISGNGSFTFISPLNTNATYSVTVQTHPSSPTQFCSVTNGTGTISNSNVSDISIICSSLSVTFSSNSYTYSINSVISPTTPIVTGTITTCSANPTLPTGLNLNNTTCEITGTPTINQSATNYIITASNSNLTTTTTINITVNSNAPSALTFVGSPYTYTQNTAITTATPTFSGTATSCSSSPALPAGLTIDNTTCAISGTPTTTQAATSYTITVSNAIGSTTASINITVSAPPPAPSALTYSSSSYTFKRNASITTITPTVTGTVTSCSAAPALPAGLSIDNTTCAITGTPTVNQGTTSYTITASNAGGSTTATFSIIVQTTVYKIFVTATAYTGNLRGHGVAGDGPAGADNLCNADSNKPNTSSYKAILFANGLREARPTLNNWVLQANTVYVRGSDSAPIFTTNASSIFTFGSLTNPFDSGAQKQYWTGFRGSGNEWELGLYRCNEWQSSSAVVTGRFGLSDATNYDSISTGVQNSCNLSKYILCAEQ